MRRPALLALVSTAALGVASAMLAFGLPIAVPFETFVSRDVLIQIPMAFAMVALFAGAAFVERFGRRMRVERSSTVAAAHLGIAGFFLTAYASFPLMFWPAFAENRFDFGFDLRHGGKWVVGAWILYLVIALVVAIPLTRKRTSSPAAARFALVGITVVTCIALLFGARRIQAQPRGYLATLAPVVLDIEGPPRTQVGSLCIWRGERRDLERGISIAQLARGASCPDEATASATRRDPGSQLFFDAKHDVFFEPSKYHGANGNYLSQLSIGRREIATLRDVGAPPPRMLFYCAIAALVLALVLEVERSRGRELRSSNVAIVGALAAPLVVATIIGT
jgi:hypothetical protein